MEQNKQSAPQNAASEAAVRRQTLADLTAAGHDPFTITKCKQDAFSADLKEEYKDLPAEEDTGRMVSLAGRMMSKRVMGKASFAHLRDAKGDIQINAGAERAFVGERATSLLLVGVTSIAGDFEKDDIVRIINEQGEQIGVGCANYSSEEARALIGARDQKPLVLNDFLCLD